MIEAIFYGFLIRKKKGFYVLDYKIKFNDYCVMQSDGNSRKIDTFREDSTSKIILSS